MKTQLIITLLILMTVATTYSQSDSIIFTNNIKCFVNNKSSMEKKVSNKFETRNDITEIGNVKSLTFLNKDSLILGKQGGKTYGLNIKNLREVNVKSGSQGFLGFTLGFLTGWLIGFVLTPSSSGSGNYAPVEGEKIIGAFLGGIVFGAVGAFVGSAIDDLETLNVIDIPEKDKKTEIIKFLRMNK